jgi:lipid-binding SYLF domain-containing protein
MMQLRTSVICSLALSAIVACGSTTPSTSSGRANLEARADATLAMMKERDPGLATMLGQASGYIVFPEIAKGGVIAGAAHGRGILYERGMKMGFVELNQASLGAQLGGQTFSELVVLDRPMDVAKIKDGEFSLGANASAVVLDAGVAEGADFDDGVAVFIVPRGGLMAELSISGQKLNFAPRGG